MAGRVRTFNRPGKKIDFKQWIGLPGLSDSQTAAGTIIGGSLAFAIPATILRIRPVRLYAAFDATQQAGDTMDLAFAIGIASTDAVTLGATAIPDPQGEVEFPWLWWGAFALRSFVNAQPSDSWGVNGQLLESDTRAMRKVKPGESLFWAIQLSGATGAPVTLIEIEQARVLVGT